MEIVGVDAGNYEIKVVGERGRKRILSDIGEFRERNLVQKHSQDDVEFEYEGRRGFAGTLAQFESEFSGSIMGDTKAHEDAVIRTLIGLWIYNPLNTRSDYQIVVGQPISKHNNEEKEKIKQMLKKVHYIKINGTNYRINIDRVEVAAEGGAAFWSEPKKGLVRIIDIGSATVNCASLIDGRYIDRDSFTLPFGMNSTKSNDRVALARAIATEALKKWRPGDQVEVVGGAAHDLMYPLHQYFGVVRAMGTTEFANATGFYRIGMKIYGETN